MLTDCFTSQGTHIVYRQPYSNGGTASTTKESYGFYKLTEMPCSSVEDCLSKCYSIPEVGSSFVVQKYQSYMYVKRPNRSCDYVIIDERNSQNFWFWDIDWGMEYSPTRSVSMTLCFSSLPHWIHFYRRNKLRSVDRTRVKSLN